MHSLKLSHGGFIDENHNEKNGNKNNNGNSTNYNLKKQNPAKVGDVFNPYTYEIIEESAQFIRERISISPKIAIICGSGLGTLADLIEDKAEFPYEIIPNFPVSTVSGHAGKLVIGNLNNVPVICMKGRFHFYEGYPLWKCAMPIRVFKLLGIEVVIVTNAAGGLNPTYKVGDVMLIKDHINFPGFAGENPLVGFNDERFGPRFVAVNKAYDRDLLKLAKEVGENSGMSSYLREGVYTMVAGPNYETVSELQLLKLLGVDAVGMSTVPEVITAKHCGMICLGFSLITNECIIDHDDDAEPDHLEVMEVAEKRQEDLKIFISQLLPHIERRYL